MLRTREIEVRPLRRSDWPTVARLFGANGACGGCWCMYWHVECGGKLWEEVKGQKNRDRMRRLVKAGRIHAVLAFEGGEPVGWCAFGPRTSFPRIETVRALRYPYPDSTWSIVCFFLPTKRRGKGLATKLLTAATERAFKKGASVVEGYPVDPKSKVMPGAFAWTGVPRLFARCGYRRFKNPAGSRPVFRATGSSR